MKTAERKVVVGSPDPGSLKASGLERAFLSVQQESRRSQRRKPGYGRNLNMRQRTGALYFEVYNFVRRSVLGAAPGLRLALEFKP